eukprot:965740-Rhodomonas_salina.3
MCAGGDSELRCPTPRLPRPSYACAMPCPVLTDSRRIACYSNAMACPVLSSGMLLPGAGGEGGECAREEAAPQGRDSPPTPHVIGPRALRDTLPGRCPVCVSLRAEKVGCRRRY